MCSVTTRLRRLGKGERKPGTGLYHCTGTKREDHAICLDRPVHIHHCLANLLRSQNRLQRVDLGEEEVDALLAKFCCEQAWQVIVSTAAKIWELLLPAQLMQHVCAGPSRPLFLGYVVIRAPEACRHATATHASTFADAFDLSFMTAVTQVSSCELVAHGMRIYLSQARLQETRAAAVEAMSI